jgi:hypothetical protein
MNNEQAGKPKLRPAEKPLPIEAPDQAQLYQNLNRIAPTPGGELPKRTLPRQDRYSGRESQG